MAWTIKPRRSTTAAAVPTTAQLADGEIALNAADSVAYMRNGSAIVRLGVFDATYISGFKIRSSTSNVSFSEGFAYIQGYGVVRANAQAVAPGSILSATWYYAYLDPTGSITMSVTAPTGVQVGTARYMSGDATKRFLFAIRSVALNTFPLVVSDAGQNSCSVKFLFNTGLNSRLISGGTSTVAADVSASTQAPADVTETLCLHVQNTATTTSSLVRIYTYTGSVFDILNTVQGLGACNFDIPCDATPKTQYAVANSAVANIDMIGYTYSR